MIWQGYLSLFTKVTETQSTTATAAATAIAANVHVGNPHALSSPINLIKKNTTVHKKSTYFYYKKMFIHKYCSCCRNKYI